MTRKLLSFLLALTMTFNLLATASLAEDGAQPDWHGMEKYTFDWTTYFTAVPAEDAHTIKLIEETFNVDINMLPIEDSNFLEVLNTYIMGGDTPDVIRLKDPGQFVNYVDQGVVGEINMDILREYAPMICESIDAYQNGNFWSYGVVDGVQYGIPALAGGNIFHLPVIYNKTWMDSVGVSETPKTLEAFEDLMRKFAKEDPDGNGIDDTYGLSSDGLRQLFGAYGINPGAPDGRTDHSFFQLIEGQVEYAAATEQYKEALKVARRWYDEGLIDPEFITGENTGGYWAISNSLINHRIGMTVRGNYYHWTMAGDYEDFNEAGVLEPLPADKAGNVAKEFANANPTEDLIFGDPVTGPYGSGIKNWNMLAQFYVFSPEVCEDEGKFARICAIMEYMCRQYSASQDIKGAYWTDVYGEEGDLWYWQDYESNVPAWTDKYRELYPEFAAVDEFGPTQWGPSLATSLTSRRDRFAYGLGYDQHGITNLVQFSLPSMAENETNLTNLKDQWMIAFITGKKDVDADWDAYIAEMNASGLSAILTEVREWYASTTAK